MVSPYLARVPSDPVQFAVKQNADAWTEFCKMHHSFAVEKGPSGFLPMYGLSVLAAAISAAFDRPMDDDNPPFVNPTILSPLPVGRVVFASKVRPKSIGRPCEDGCITHRLDDYGLVFLAAIDGHGGHEIMEMIKENAVQKFTTAFELEEQGSRTARIRRALKQMHWELDTRANNMFGRLKS